MKYLLAILGSIAILTGCNTATNLSKTLTSGQVTEVITSERPVGSALEILFAGGICADVQDLWNLASDETKTADAEDGFIEACTFYGTLGANFVPITAVVYADPVVNTCNRTPSKTSYANSSAYEVARASACVE